jgi:hypothetical protein
LSFVRTGAVITRSARPRASHDVHFVPASVLTSRHLLTRHRPEFHDNFQLSISAKC